MKSTLCRLLVLSLLLSQFLTLTPAAQAQQESKEEKDLRKKQEQQAKKEQELKEKEAKARDKNSKRYNTLREFAEDQYASDPEFRDASNKAYLDLQGQHALDAYRINTSRVSETLFAENEDQTLKIRRTLYDNPWVQDYVNRVGQRLVPADSTHLYAFKVVYHPIPYAYTLSTGTILISTGMISLLDNEAQLAYVLAHELAHVYKDHWKLKVIMPLAENEYLERQAKKRAIWAAVLGGAGAAIGAGIDGKNGAFLGLLGGAATGFVIGTMFNRSIGVDWEEVQENQADEIALRLALDKSYDPQEVPKLLIALDGVARTDERMQLGFLGHRARIQQRTNYVNSALQGPLNGKFQELTKAGKLVGTSPEFNRVMAELKRDNGIVAFQHDMFEMAKRNLQQAVSMRSDDARASYYYGRVLKQIGRTPEELNTAQQHLLKAISLDQQRLTMPEAHLQKALMLMDRPDAASQSLAVQAIKDYITVYQRRRAETGFNEVSLPPNIDVLYDFMRVLGEKSWRPPTANQAIDAAMKGTPLPNTTTSVPVVNTPSNTTTTPTPVSTTPTPKPTPTPTPTPVKKRS